MQRRVELQSDANRFNLIRITECDVCESDLCDRDAWSFAPRLARMLWLPEKRARLLESEIQSGSMNREENL